MTRSRASRWATIPGWPKGAAGFPAGNGSGSPWPAPSPIAHRPTVLLLDEATSSLDVATEAIIERNLREAAPTRIVIAHRLSTVRDADQILFIEDGRVVERGTHDDLMAQEGRYAALVNQQLADVPSAVRRDERPSTGKCFSGQGSDAR